MRGRFIVFEGGEGSGKSTQAALLAEDLDALLTRQPGGTAIGARLRELLLAAPDADSGADGAPMAERAEALLMAADRAQHVAELIVPALESGSDVVCDRYIPSTLAYQGAGRGLDVDELARISGWASAGLVPDVVVLLVVGPDVSRERTGGARDRIEAAGAEFHRRVVASFVDQAASDPDRWVVIDGEGTIDDVRERVRAAVTERLGSDTDADLASGSDPGGSAS